MPRFKIYGADSRTAKDTSITITANTPDEAESIAVNRGLFVSRVIEVEVVERVVQPQQVPAYQPPIPKRKGIATCKVCDSGIMIPMRVYIMSQPVVAIGYIILIPFIMIMFGVVVTFLMSLKGGLTTGYSITVYTYGTLFALTFVGSLLGWLLIMKKKILRCNKCGAIVNAY